MLTLELSELPRLPGFRAIHGVNNGPFLMDGLVDLSSYFREARFPDIRFHDPLYPGRNVVDINAVFPDMAADPEDARSYDFARTDHYLKHAAATGATLTYRLGYTIDHHPVKRFCFMPEDVEKFARVCLGIVRHYNGEWAGGFKDMVARWEIWNEPDLDTTLDMPSATSTTFRGSWRDYFRLYEAVAVLLKREFPEAGIGGTAVTGMAIRSGFLEQFLAYARERGLPLDFLSWHTYTGNAISVAEDAREVRRMLDAAGFSKAESCLTEWHFTPPGADWRYIMTPADHLKKQQLSRDMTGHRCAAFTAATLLLLQDAPLTMANFYNGDDMVFFGLFDRLGTPLKPYYALLAFSKMLECTHRLALQEMPANLHAAAGMMADGRLRLMLVNNSPDYVSVRLKLAEGRAPRADSACRMLSGEHDLVAWPLDDDYVHLPTWSVALVEVAL